MRGSQRSAQAEPSTAPSTPTGQGAGIWLRVARRAWIGGALILLVIFAANVPAYYQTMRHVCTLPNPSNCLDGQLTPVYVHLFTQVHVPVALATLFFFTLTLTVALAYCGMGVLIFWRKSQDWTGCSPAGCSSSLAPWALEAAHRRKRLPWSGA